MDGGPHDSVKAGCFDRKHVFRTIAANRYKYGSGPAKHTHHTASNLFI